MTKRNQVSTFRFTAGKFFCNSTFWKHETKSVLDVKTWTQRKVALHRCHGLPTLGCWIRQAALTKPWLPSLSQQQLFHSWLAVYKVWQAWYDCQALPLPYCHMRWEFNTGYTMHGFLKAFSPICTSPPTSPEYDSLLVSFLGRGEFSWIIVFINLLKEKVIKR